MNGIFIPGAVVLGRTGNSGSADLSDIDLTSEKLDPRLKYQCASHHAFHAADGTIQFAEPNAWPLEYRDGMPVGRHEPEPQATNYATSISQLIGVTQGDAVTGPGGELNFYAYTENSARDEHYARCSLSALAVKGDLIDSCYVSHIPDAEGMMLRAIHRATGYTTESYAQFNWDGTKYVPGELYGYAKSSGVIDCGGVFRVWSQYTVPSEAVITLRELRLAVNKYGIYDGDGRSGARLWRPNTTSGTVLSSVIAPDGTSAVTRAAAFASVKNPGGFATSIRVSYSDGTTADINFPADGADIQLPQAAVEWGSRYITRIQFARALK